MAECHYYTRLRGRSRCDHPRRQGASGCPCYRPITCPYLLLDRAEAAEADAERLVGAVYLQRNGHPDHLVPINCIPGTCRTCDAMHAALAAHAKLKRDLEVT